MALNNLFYIRFKGKNRGMLFWPSLYFKNKILIFSLKDLYTEKQINNKFPKILKVFFRNEKFILDFCNPFSKNPKFQNIF